jgi:DNA/RNA endonuclease YhcR with UshA esterase domain
MKDSTLLKIALATSTIGLAALAIILSTTGFEEVNISEAKELEKETTIMISGTVERVTSKEDFAIINIRKEETITVIAFDKINLSKGQRVEVTGEIREYQGEKELVADKIVIK